MKKDVKSGQFNVIPRTSLSTLRYNEPHGEP